MSNKPIKNFPGIVPPPDYKLNPLSNNWVYCPEGKVINPATGRCVKKDSKTISHTPPEKYPETTYKKETIKNVPGYVPPPDYKLNPLSNNWVYCPEGKVINPITGRCVNKDSKSISQSQSQTPSQKYSETSYKKETIKNVPGFVPPPDYKLNPLSNNWVYCPEGKVINPITGRCVKKDSKTISHLSQNKYTVIPSKLSPSHKQTSPKLSPLHKQTSPKSSPSQNKKTSPKSSPSQNKKTSPKSSPSQNKQISPKSPSNSENQCLWSTKKNEKCKKNAVECGLCSMHLQRSNFIESSIKSGLLKSSNSDENLSQAELDKKLKWVYSALYKPPRG